MPELQSGSSRRTAFASRCARDAPWLPSSSLSSRCSPKTRSIRQSEASVIGTPVHGACGRSGDSASDQVITLTAAGLRSHFDHAASRDGDARQTDDT